jgi:hypothetical protein
MASSPSTSKSDRLQMGSSNCLQIFYQNARGLRTKSVKIFNVSSLDYKIICLTETWLSASFSTHKFFPETYTVYRSDRYFHDKLRGGVLTAVSNIFFGVKRRPDLDFFHESVWVAFTLSDGRNVLFGNRYFAPDIKVNIINNLLENSFDTLNYRILFLGDFNVPGFNWNHGSHSTNSHFYTKLKGDVIQSAICYFGLIQRNHPVNGFTLLDLVFSNFVDISLDYVEHGLVHPDRFHRPFIIDCTIPLRRKNQHFNTPYKIYSAGYHALLHKALLTYDWSVLYTETSVAAAVDRLNAAITQATNLAVPSGCVTKQKYPIWFSGRLRTYIKKNYFYRRYTKCKTDSCYDRFSFYRKLVK